MVYSYYLFTNKRPATLTITPSIFFKRLSFSLRNITDNITVKIAPNAVTENSWEEFGAILKAAKNDVAESPYNKQRRIIL